MRELYSSPVAGLDFDEARHLFVFSWKTPCVDLNEIEIRSEFAHLPEYVSVYRPGSLLLDSGRFPHFGNPDITAWMDMDFFPAIGKLGVRRIGVVAPEEAINHLRDSNIFPAEDWEVDYFTERAEAMRWLQPA